MSTRQIFFTGLMVSTQLLHAMTFSHHDWEVTCDNTNTCRIAGYSTYYSSLPISVLLISKANLLEPIEAKVQIGNFSEEIEDFLKKLPSPFKLELLINDKSYGHVSMHKNNLISSLTQKQTEALIDSLKANSTIVLRSGKYLWKLSDKGSAVLLKVDEFQKRLHTPVALLKKGNKSIKSVSTAKAIPIIYAKTVESDQELTLSSQKINALHKVLKSDQTWCFEEHLYDPKIRLYPLNSNKLLASKLCWTAAYNMGTAYWVINKQAPYNPKLITTEATNYSTDENKVATIHVAQKGRGIGDCWSHESYVWEGENFVLSSDGHTGACRAITSGGTWDFANFVSKVEVK